MSDLCITKENSVNIHVACERDLAKELSEYFTFKVPGHKFMPSYRKKNWDGTIKLYNIYSQNLYAGLIPYVKKFASDRGYSLEIEESLRPSGPVKKISTVGGKPMCIKLELNFCTNSFNSPFLFASAAPDKNT